MEKEELLNRISKKEEAIKKIEKRIIKWKNNLISEDECKKSHCWLTPEQYAEREEAIKANWIHDCEYEIRRAESDLNEANIAVTKYKNALLLLEEKESKPVIKIFKDFFNNWKNKINEFVDINYAKYLEANHKYCETYNYYREDDRKELLESLRKEEKKY